MGSKDAQRAEDGLTPGRKSTLREYNIVETRSDTGVLNTSSAAFNCDSRVVVLSDCVASMYGDDLHVPGLQNVVRCQGRVISNDQLFGKTGSAGSTPRAAQVS